MVKYKKLFIKACSIKDNIENIHDILSRNEHLNPAWGLDNSCKKGNINNVKYLIDNYAFKLENISYYKTAFSSACNNNHINIVKFLLSNNIFTYLILNNNYKYLYDDFKFVAVCKNNYYRIIEELLPLRRTDNTPIIDTKILTQAYKKVLHTFNNTEECFRSLELLLNVKDDDRKIIYEGIRDAYDICSRDSKMEYFPRVLDMIMTFNQDRIHEVVVSLFNIYSLAYQKYYEDGQKSYKCIIDYIESHKYCLPIIVNDIERIFISSCINNISVVIKTMLSRNDEQYDIITDNIDCGIFNLAFYCETNDSETMNLLLKERTKRLLKTPIYYFNSTNDYIRCLLYCNKIEYAFLTMKYFNIRTVNTYYALDDERFTDGYEIRNITFIAENKDKLNKDITKNLGICNYMMRKEMINFVVSYRRNILGKGY
jgi:hypothetical protein